MSCESGPVSSESCIVLSKSGQVSSGVGAV